MNFFFRTKTYERFGETYERKELITYRVFMVISAALLFISILLSSFTIVPSGYTGVVTKFGQIDENVAPSGFMFKIPFVQSIKKVNNKQQEITFKDQVWGESSERTVVFMSDVTVTYRINPEYSAWLYANVSDYKQNALPQTLVASALKASMVSLKSEDVTNRAKIEPICVDNLQAAIDKKYGGEPVISIVNVNVNNMDFEDSYNKAIAEKQVAQMQYEKKEIENLTAINTVKAEAEQRRITAEAEANRQVIAAKAEADAITAVASAQADANKKLANSITDSLIDYEKIQKWDGKMPTVSGTSAIVSIDGVE